MFSFSKAEYYKIIWRYIQLIPVGYLLKTAFFCVSVNDSYVLLGLSVLYS